MTCFDLFTVIGNLPEFSNVLYIYCRFGTTPEDFTNS